MKRTIKTEAGNLQLHSTATGAWIYDISAHTHAIATRTANGYALEVTHTSKNGKYIDGTKRVTSKAIGNYPTLAEVTKAIIHYTQEV